MHLILKTALIITILNQTAFACGPSPMPYMPLLFENGKFVQKPEFLNKQHMQQAMKLIKPCAEGMNAYIVEKNGEYYISANAADNKGCISDVTKRIEAPDDLSLPAIQFDKIKL